MLQCGTGGIEEADRISRWRLAAVSSAGFARRVANGVLMASLVLYTDGLINSQVVTSVRRFNGSLLLSIRKRGRRRKTKQNVLRFFPLFFPFCLPASLDRPHSLHSISSTSTSSSSPLFLSLSLSFSLSLVPLHSALSRCY